MTEETKNKIVKKPGGFEFLPLADEEATAIRSTFYESMFYAERMNKIAEQALAQVRSSDDFRQLETRRRKADDLFGKLRDEICKKVGIDPAEWKFDVDNGGMVRHVKTEESKKDNVASIDSRKTRKKRTPKRSSEEA